MKMSEGKLNFGQIQIADEVIAVIAATAATEVEGVLNTSAASGKAFVEFLGMKSQSRGVKVIAEDGEVSLDVDIVVIFGTQVQVVAKDVQKKVKNAVETMTGLCVTNVNVSVSGIAKEKPLKATKLEAEEE